MLVADAQASFEAFLVGGGSRPDDVDAAHAVVAMMDWYGLERATDAASPDDDGDMLLFQWGPYDWGQGRFFEVDITRQLVLASEIDDDAIMQLSFTFRYTPGASTDPVGKGHQWCYRPSELDAFRDIVATHAAMRFVRAATPLQRELRFENAG